MITAIIPARGGSKRVPRKNIRPFHGRPMIAWTISAALESGCFDRILVSTDDSEIAAIARVNGAETPFVRPMALSDDHTGTGAVVSHALEWLAATGYSTQFACCLYPAAVLLDPRILQLGLRLIRDEGGDFVFPVVEYPHPVQRALRIDPDGRTHMENPDFGAVRTQDLERLYHDAGQFYWGGESAWLSGRTILGGNSRSIIVPRASVVDIDTEADWEQAELIFAAKRVQAGIDGGRT